jgi:hypothetical protein
MSYSTSRKAKNFKLSGFFKLSSITLHSDSWGKQFATSRSRSHFIVLVVVGGVSVIGGKIIFLLVVAVAGGATDACDGCEHLL